MNLSMITSKITLIWDKEKRYKLTKTKTIPLPQRRWKITLKTKWKLKGSRVRDTKQRNMEKRNWLSIERISEILHTEGWDIQSPVAAQLLDRKMEMLLPLCHTENYVREKFSWSGKAGKVRDLVADYKCKKGSGILSFWVTSIRRKRKAQLSKRCWGRR